MLALRLTHRHKDILVALLLPITRALALGLHLGLADSPRALVLLAIWLALFSKRNTLFFGEFAETRGGLDLLGGEAVVAVAVFFLLALATVAHCFVDGGGHAEFLEFGEIGGCKDGCGGELGDAVNFGLLLL